MKSSIIIFLACLSLSLNAQIAFEGTGTTVDSLNTANGQNYLVLNPFQKGMAFTEEKGGVATSSDLFTSKEVVIEGMSWQVLVFPDWLGEKGMLSPLGFTPFGVFYSEVTFDKGMYYGEVKFSSNGKVEEVDIPFLRNKAPIQSGCLSKDGRYMILSMESNNTAGVEDLYLVKKKSDGSWDRAKNLGFQLNTEFQEVTPFLAEDNRTLFFATNGRGGQGSFDLFYTVRQDESWRNWSEPVNLGPQVNTSGSETSFAYLDGSEWAYYISSKDSDGYGDIMKVKFKENIAEDTAVVEEPVEEMTVAEVVASEAMIQIVDKKTDEYLSAQLIFDTLILPVPAGVFVLDSSFLKYGEVEIKSEGYLPVRFALEDNLIMGENKIALERVKKGETIALSHVLFHRGTPDLIEDSYEELDLVVEMLNDNPKIKILLKGHTDNTGDPVRNVQLSEARVRAVKEYIISQGISPYRVTGKGYGGNQPIARNETEETRKLNRRVEFEVIED
ncbi:Outer membrane protein OmpA [Ekhidna lutea]|uniref:Outer membrane protein OmpA n=1 Tax=Ekhidna lutea TaxID=447679 RepID=A0A239K3Y4_EKHLU|nr:OmpA family protein [Ekhidna lutea]SNT13057.1 Outer membrane protein OmpA [Ekhidna lutea]